MAKTKSAQKISPAALGRAALKIFKFDATWLDLLATQPRQPLAIFSITSLVIIALIQVAFVYLPLDASLQTPSVLAYALLSQLSFAGTLVLVNALLARWRKLPGQWLPMTFGVTTASSFTLLMMTLAIIAKHTPENVVAVPLMLLGLASLVYLLLLCFFIISTALRLQTYWHKVLWFLVSGALIASISTVFDEVLGMLLIHSLKA